MDLWDLKAEISNVNFFFVVAKQITMRFVFEAQLKLYLTDLAVIV